MRRSDTSMVFNSFLFILIFLPITIAGWFLLNRRNEAAAEWFLIGMSLWFYGSFSPWYLAILAVSVALNYTIGRCVPGKKGLLGAGIVLNLVLLGWFKYVTPQLDALQTGNTILRSLAAVGLPVGLSFYTFSQISYLIDRYREEIGQDGLRRYLLYLSYFPKIVEGPITRYEELAAQFRDPERRKFSPEHLSRGILLFVFGLGKKLLIADVLAGPAVFGIQSAYYLDTLSVIVTMSCYALQLYFDFSGFCDMAMGISWMLNLDLPLNFDAPFQAKSFPEFWKRWHMTLTRFFTRYVYIPLGGSRRGTLRTCLNVMVVFLLSALWHGISLNYLIWGLLSGALVVAGNLLGKGKKEKELSAGSGSRANVQARFVGKSGKETERSRGKWRALCTFALFLVTLVFFGAPDPTHSLAILKNLLRPMWPGWLYRMAGQMSVPEFWLLNKLTGAAAPAAKNPLLLAELLLVLAAAMLLCMRKTAVKIAGTMQLNRRNAVLAGLLLVWCLCSMSGVSTYLYFKF